MQHKNNRKLLAKCNEKSKNKYFCMAFDIVSVQSHTHTCTRTHTVKLWRCFNSIYLCLPLCVQYGYIWYVCIYTYVCLRLFVLVLLLLLLLLLPFASHMLVQISLHFLCQADSLPLPSFPTRRYLHLCNNSNAA